VDISGNKSSMIEWSILILVVVSVFSIAVEPDVDNGPELEVTHITGTMGFNTEASLEMIGLDDSYHTNVAVAEIEMDSRGIISNGCEDCTTSPHGVQMNGTITVTGLSGPLTRIEGTLNITHLSEHVQDSLISREWLSVDWSAGDLSERWDLIIVHDPPRWTPEHRYRASFIEIENGNESRTGPWIFVETLLNHSLNAEGCLPNSLRCKGFPSSDIELMSIREPVSTPMTIAHPGVWSQQSGSMPLTNNTPSKIGNFRDSLNVGNEVNATPWCQSTDEDLLASKSWTISETGDFMIAPMSNWLDALALPSVGFILNDGIWSEADYTNRGCASLMDHDGELQLGIMIS